MTYIAKRMNLSILALFMFSLVFFTGAVHAEAKTPTKAEYKKHYLQYYNDTEVFFGSKKETQAQINETYDAAMKIAKAAPKAANAKVKYFHDELCKRCSFSTSKDIHYTAYGALVLTKACCTGYSSALETLCYLSEVPCKAISGETINSTPTSGHTWNIVKLQDGQWYEIDVTWDDDGKNPDNTYLLKSTKQMSTDHIRVPMIGVKADKNVWPEAKGTKYKNKARITYDMSINNIMYECCEDKAYFRYSMDGKKNPKLPKAIYNGYDKQFKYTVVNKN